MADENDIAAKFAELNAASEKQASEQKGRAQKFSAFHDSVFKDIEEWVLRLPDSGVDISDMQEKAVSASEYCGGFSSRTLILTHPNLTPMRVQGSAWNQINFTWGTENVPLTLAVSKSGGKAHTLTIPAKSKSSLSDRSTSVKLPPRKEDWSQDSFNALLSNWIDTGKSKS